MTFQALKSGKLFPIRYSGFSSTDESASGAYCSLSLSERVILLRIAQAIPRRVVSRNCVNGSLFHPTSTLKVSHQSRDDTTKSYALPIAQRITDAIGQFHSVAVRFLGRLFVTVCVTIFSASISLISLSVLFGNHSHSGVTIGSHGFFGGLAVGSIQRSFRSNAVCTGTHSDIVLVDAKSPVRKYAGISFHVIPENFILSISCVRSLAIFHSVKLVSISL